MANKKEEFFEFTYQEVVESLIKRADVHEGLWGPRITFGLGVSNVGPDEQHVSPAAILTVATLGIQRFPKPSNMTVDAAATNPKPTPARRTPGKKK